MEFFSTPKRKSIRRLNSAHSSSGNLAALDSLSCINDDLLQSQNDENDDDDDNLRGGRGSMTSWRKIRKRVRVSHFGSVLHRNSVRGDHLRKLFVKRRIKEAIMDSMTIDEVRNAANLSSNIPQSFSGGEQGYELSANTGAMDMMDKFDESFLNEVKAEIEKEMKQEPPIIQELYNIAKEYDEIMHGFNEFPLEVRLKNFSYIVPIEEKSSKIMTVYNASCIYPIAQHVKRYLLNETKQLKEIRRKRILQNINLVLKPGKQYLLLGPPGSGKSVLLQAIAGLVQAKKGNEIEGSISYNGRTLAESHEFFIKNAFAYIDQLDKHAPRLTVEETFDFAYQCTTGGKFIRQDVPPEIQCVMEKADKEHLATRLVLAGLGLTEVKDTYVGDTDIRGVSGGQRRRVTVGEMLMSRAPILCGDAISTGLDAASTYDMIQVIVHAGRKRKQTGIFSLLQPSPETVSLFDDVIVMADGHIIFAGPIEEVEDYFAGIGFLCPEFTDVADFLQMVSSGDFANLYDPDERVLETRPSPPTIAELAALFEGSDFGRLMLQALDSPLPYVWTKTEGEEKNSTSTVSNLVMSDAVRKKYANRFPRSTYLILRRFIILWLRDRRVIVAGAVKNILMGVSVGGAFFSTEDQLSIQGALFQAGLFIMLGAMQSSSGLLQDRIIYYKHTDANFYSAWPFVFGRVLSQMPQTIADTVTFATIMYYQIGLAGRTNVTNFLIYLSILIAFAVLMNTQLSLFASFATGSQMQVYSSVTLLAMMLFGGFILPPDAIPNYFTWLYWWNPFAWAYRALIVNEFYSARWDDPYQILHDAGFVDPTGTVYRTDWIGFSFAFTFLYLLVCCVLSALSLTYIRHQSGPSMESTSPRAKVSKVLGSTTQGAVDIPFVPVTLSFQNIGYQVTASTTNEQLSLLNNVNGIFRPGQMCALMGSSGAGKTTLMDVISLRKRSGIISGEVRLNGWMQDPISFRRCSGYVEQFDVQSPELTIRETVLFSARLRLDPSIVDTDEKKQAFVDYILEEVELTLLANDLVGTDEDGGLTFEQKKRLSIAVELAASPSLLFLDEPTSGLDARSANLIVRTLRKIANGNRTICATIHQPSSAVFEMFDELLLLKKGGTVVYHGPLGYKCETLVTYFESRGVPPISLGENPANWMLRVVNAEEENELSEQYVVSKEYAKLLSDMEVLKDTAKEISNVTYDSEFASSGSRRRELINGRLRKIYWRSPAYNLARLMVSLIIAGVLGSVFIFRRNLDFFSEVDIQARLSVVFISFIITGIMAILSVLPVMTKIRDMFYRHRDAGMYDSYSIGLALGVAEKGFIVVSSALFCTVFLSSSGFSQDASSSIAFWGFFTFNFAIYSYMGQLFVCLVKPTATAIILCSVFIGLNNFFAGLIVRPQFLVGGFYAIPYYITPGHYVYESLVMTLFTKDTRMVLANVDSDFYNYLVETNICEIGQSDCHGSVSDYVNVFFGFEYSIENTRRNAYILGFVLVLARVLTWVALKYIRFAS